MARKFVFLVAKALLLKKSWFQGIFLQRPFGCLLYTSYAEKVKLSLEHEGFEVVVFDFLEGEASKNLKTVNKAYEFLIKNGMTRSDGIVALGGGVVGDLAGFVASTYMRGIHFVQVPTSLTAQVDSSIGGKTGVNTPFAKNIVGTFAQPDGVLIDPNVLETLGKRELIEGMGEVVKYGLIDDPELWHLLESIDGSVHSILENSETIIYLSLIHIYKKRFLRESLFLLVLKNFRLR